VSGNSGWTSFCGERCSEEGIKWRLADMSTLQVMNYHQSVARLIHSTELWTYSIMSDIIC
jgi:hypothetical protein